MTTIAGVYSPRLLCLRPILRRWVRLNRKIAHDWSSWRDIPWWYNERASLSVLAGAVWRHGGLAFEEFSDEKRSASQRRGAPFRRYNGRVDIYVEVNANYFIGESKFCWVRASQRSQNQARFMKKFLDHAKSDIRKSRPYGQRRLAILFATPFVSTKQKDGIKARIEYFVDQATNLDVDAAAWVFPNIERCVSDRGWMYPGTAVIIKEVKR